MLSRVKFALYPGSYWADDFLVLLLGAVMIDLVSSIPEAIKAIADAVKAAIDSVNSYKARQSATKATNWARVLDALATAKKLVAEHLETARIITAPVRIKGDLDSTAKLLRQFVDTGALPLAYDEVQGGLEQLIQSGAFSTEAIALMRDLRKRLAVFQYEAFMIRYSSWAMTDAIEWVAELVKLLDGPDAGSGKARARINELRRLLKDENAWWQFRQLPSKLTANEDSRAEPETADEMISVVRTWLKDWFEHVQQTLYGGAGINHLVGALEKMG
jgi:hypothetical protein